MKTSRKWTRIGGMIVAAALAAWVAPPVFHALRHLCPARPDGVSEAAAVPSFARKYKVSCTACHTAWPALNEHGRQFKLNGYRQERDETADTIEVGGMSIPASFPFAAVVKSRPYDKTNNKDGEFRSRALHEIELFIAGGGIGPDLSYFTEIEMEDEPDAITDSNGDEAGRFTPNVVNLQGGWHPKEWFNVLVAHRSFFDMDPYQTLGQHGKLSINKRLAPNAGQVTGHAMDSETQTVMAYGEAMSEGIGSLYYAAGWTADPGDSEGKGGKDANVRLAYDTLHGLAVGAFGSLGTTGVVARNATPSALRYKQSRIGVDLLAEVAGLTVRGAGIYFYDRTEGSNARASNRGGYVEALYPIKIEGMPMIVPSIRQDYVTMTDGKDHASAVSVQLAAYLKPNVKALVDYMAEESVTPAAGKDHRWVAQVEFGF